MIDMSLIASMYAQIILEFLIELLVFLVILFRNFKRRKLFVLRLVLSFAGVAAIGFGLTFFYYFYGNTVLGRSFVYFVLFFALVGAGYICFDEKIIPIIYMSGIAYAIQNIMYKVWLIFYVSMEMLGWPNNWRENFFIFYRLIYYFFIGLFMIATFVVIIKRFNYNITERHFSKKMISLTIMCLVITVILCSFQDVYFARFTTIRENHYDDISLFFLRQSGNLLSVLACILVLYLGSKSIIESKLEKEVEYLEHTIKQSKQQYEISKDTIEMINIKCHDIKYQIQSLANTGSVSQEDLVKLEESVKIYDSKFETGNQLLNVLLLEKSLYCEQHNITFSCMIDGENFDFMESGDLYCLFGNMIDNALEAVIKIKDKSKRIINLSVKRRANLILIEEDNYYAGELEFVDGLPVTTKDDKNYHGFGTRSLRILVRKYGGELTTSSTNNIFHLSIILVDNTTK